MAPETLATNLYLGRVVATARQRKGWTHNDLAEAAGLGRFVLLGIEAGRMSLTPERRVALIRALALQPGALDAPGFVVLSDEEHRLIAERRQGAARPRARLLGGRLAPLGTKAASC